MRAGPAELLVVLAIALLIWGPAKLPELGKSLGQAVRGFREGIEDTSEYKEKS